MSFDLSSLKVMTVYITCIIKILLLIWRCKNLNLKKKLPSPVFIKLFGTETEKNDRKSTRNLIKIAKCYIVPWNVVPERQERRIIYGLWMDLDEFLWLLVSSKLLLLAIAILFLLNLYCAAAAAAPL